MADVPAHIAEQLNALGQVVFQTAAKNLTLMLNAEVTAGDCIAENHDSLNNVIGGDSEPFGGDVAKTFIFSKLSAGDGADVAFTIKVSDASYLANTMLGNDDGGGDELDELQISALGEIFSQFLNASTAGLGEMVGQGDLSFSSPEVKPFGEEAIREQIPQLLALSLTTLTCELSIEGGNSVTFHLWVTEDEATQLASAAANSTPATTTDVPDGSGANVSADAIAAAFENIDAPMPSDGGSGSDQSVTVQPVEFASFDNQPEVNGEFNKNLDLLLDVKMSLSVRLGDTDLPLKQVLELTRGSVVELNRLAGEPVDLYANGKLIARGEVVVIEDNFGLRITSIVSPQERFRELAAL